MTVSAISHYRGGTIDEVTPLAKALKAVYVKYGIEYRLSRFETGPHVGDWLVVVRYDPDETVSARLAQDSEYQRVIAEIAKIAQRVSREVALDLDL